MWQHGNHPVHQIDACPALARLPVQGRIFLHIVCDIRNMHPQLILRAVLCQTDRIVKVFCILPVNRHHLHIPQIAPPCHIRLGHLTCHPFYLMHYFLRKFNRKLIALDNRHNIHAGVIDMAQNLCNLSLRLSVIFPIIRNLTDHLVTRHCAFGTLRRHKNILVNLRVVRDDKTKVFIRLIIDSHNLLHASCKNLDYLRLLTPAILSCALC